MEGMLGVVVVVMVVAVVLVVTAVRLWECESGQALQSHYLAPEQLTV